MSDLEFELRVQGTDVVNDVRDSIDDGMTNGGKALAEQGEDVAQTRIDTAGAIFTGELHDSFETETQQVGKDLVVTLRNTSDHAAPIEFGAEYDAEGPPVEALIPWVRAHLADKLPEGASVEPPEGIDDKKKNLEVNASDGSVVPLSEVADPEVIDAAFWLQEHIRETGIDAVHFMQKAEAWARSDGDRTVLKAIEAELAV